MTRGNPARPRLLRTLNDRSVLELLVSHGPCTRADLGALTGLSKPTIAEVVSRLESSGLLEAAGKTVGRPGPNGLMYDLSADQPLGAALSVTAGSTRCEIVDLRGQIVGSASRPRSGLPRSAAQSTSVMIAAACHDGGVDFEAVTDIAIGLPGSYDEAKDAVTFLDRLPEWTADHLAASISAAFDNGPSVTIDNDVNLALVAERATAPGRPAVMSLLWLGSGVGLATDMDGSLYRGMSGGAGEIGYIPLPVAPPGTGGASLVEFQDVVGGAAVSRLARERGVPGRSAADAVTRAARDLDSRGISFLDELANRIALGLSIIVAVLDPGVVVLGGDIGRAGGDALASRTAKALRSSGRLRGSVIASVVPDDPTLAGARHNVTSVLVERLLDRAEHAQRTEGPTPIATPMRRHAREALT